MRPRPLSPADRRVAWLALVVVAVASWLDADRCVVAQQAAVFSFVVQGLVWLGNAIGGAATFIGVHLEAVVAWLVSSLQWLTGHVASIFKATGAMFARVWDGLKTYYNAVLKPFALEVWHFFDRVRGWLMKYLGPVLKWAKRVRDELLRYYQSIIAPVLDIIDVTRASLRVLGDLGVDWARALDQKLGEWESTVTENFLWVLGQVNRVIDTVNGIVTLDGLFQRVPFLATLRRDVGLAWNTLYNARHRGGTLGDLAAAAKRRPPREPDEIRAELERYARTGMYGALTPEEDAKMRAIALQA